MLVSPTTLLVALRTIANLWRYEHQSRNAQQIADRASKVQALPDRGHIIHKEAHFVVQLAGAIGNLLRVAALMFIAPQVGNGA